MSKSKMNYVGSISILDRGDAPAQAVIDRNARSMAQRVADDTKDELEKVMTRVETIYSSFEDSEQAYNTSNMEYIQDIAELEEIMKDQVKKKKYQQQVTIFIVGFSDVSGQKFRLLQQVNEFFTENSNNIEGEDWFPSSPDLDLEEVGDKIEDSLQVARVLSHRLGDLNKEMVDFMANYAEKRASNKGKKKMEKALLQAKEDMQALAEKLQAVQADLMEKDDKLQTNFKQLEAKNLEVQKFRTAAELAKKALQETKELQEAVAERDLKILDQRQQLTRMEVDLAQSNHLKERSQTKLSSVSEETQQRVNILQKEVDEQKTMADNLKRDLSQFHDEQLAALREVHQQDMEDLKKQHAEQIKALSTDLQRAKTEVATTQHSLLELQIEKGVSDTQSEVGRQFDLESEDATSRQSSKQKAPMVIAVRQKRGGRRKESRPSTKGRAPGLKKGGSKSGGKEGKGSKPSTSGSTSGEAGTQDEGGDPNSSAVDEKRQTPATRHSRRSRSTLAPVEEFEDYDEVYDLADEQSWSTVPKEQLEGRFAQYRRICQHRLRDGDEQRQLTVAKTQRKVQLLKSQFVEHKTKWEAERKVLISQVEQAQQLQIDAEKEADQAMTQLEDFITEQERLEEEEEVRRSVILRGASGSSLSPGGARHTPAPSAPRTPLPPATPGAGPSSGAASALPTPPESRNTQNSEELQNLMQQTDDAKSQRQDSKHTSPSPSNTPGVMGALLDVSRIPVHKRAPSPTPSPEASATARPASHIPSEGQPGSPTIVKAPDEASEQAIAEATEAVVEIAEEIAVDATEEVVEFVEAVDEARAASVEEGVVGRSPAGSRSASAKGEAVPALDTAGWDSSSPQERGEWVSDLPILMLPGGRVTSAAILREPPPSRSAATQGSRSVPGSRQSRRVLIMQPKSMPGSSMRLVAGAQESAEGGSSLSSAGSFAPMALDVAALMNPKVASPTPDFLSPTPTAPASAALQRDTTQDSASVQREVTFSASLVKETPQITAGMKRKISEMERAVTRESTQAATLASEAVTKEGSGLTGVKENDQLTTEEEHEKQEMSEDKTGSSTDSATKLESEDAKPGSVDAKPESADAKPVPAADTETLTPAEVEEMRGRVTGTKSAPPGVDVTMVAKETEEGQTTPQATPGPQGTDAETVDSALEDADKQLMLEELQDLPPLDGASAADDAASTPSIHPPTTTATMGSLPTHDQLETPLADIASPTQLAKGDGDTGSELKEDVSSLEKGHTALTDDRQTSTLDGEKAADSSQEAPEGGLPGSADSTNASKTPRPPSKTPDAMIKVSEVVDDDLREESARSRASLRSDYKKRLVESRQAAEDRRAKSPHIQLPTNLSVDDELVVDDDDDDEFDDDMALPDDVKEELEEARRNEMWGEEMAGTPPPSKHPSSLSLRLAAGKWSKLLDHPILQEYLKTYHCVTTFKDTLSKLFLDKDMMSASQIVADLETLVFETDKKVMPQVEQFTNNIIFILEEIASVINSAVMVDREPLVSSLLPFSRDESHRLPPTRQTSADMFSAFPQLKETSPTHIIAPLPPPDQLPQVTAHSAPLKAMSDLGMEVRVREFAGRESGWEEGSVPSLQGSRKSSVSESSTKMHLTELHSQCSLLQVQLEEESKKHEDQLRHNTVVMMEMQDTINDLQRELSAIGKASKKPRSPASASHLSAKTPSPDQSLMFTRLDLERNAKIMKKAVLDQKLDAGKYKEAVTTMDDYVSLPAQRLVHLVKKYVHHSRMKEIEENVKNSESLDEGVFDTLDKMEALQNQRAHQWAEKMDFMGIERLRLAAMLMDSLDSIEQESGLFLIKPMYSYRGRELKAPPTQKLARPVRTQPVPRHLSAARESTTSFVPAPTPASNARRLDRQTPTYQMGMDPGWIAQPPPSRPKDGVVGSGALRSVVTPQSAHLMQQPYQTWNMSLSQTKSPLDNVQYSLNTPRMLELDINRMLIGQNNISTKLPHPPTDDRLVNASNNNLRSYVTVQRPAASLAADRPPSTQGGRDTGAPPSSPSPRPPVGVSSSDRNIPHSITSPPPLPPIGDGSGSALSSHPDDPESPRSPPGSSMYQSTTQDQEESTLYKEATRPSSQLSLTDTEQQ